MFIFFEYKDITKKTFQDVINIYEEAFPPRERLATPLVTERVKHQVYQLFVSTRDEQVVFMALLYPFLHSEFVLLGYLATHSDFRGQGMGTEFFKFVRDRLKLESKYLLLEVENPNYGDDGRRRQRRINFYRRMGAKEMKNVRFVLPALSGDESTEIILMIFPEYKTRCIDGTLVKGLMRKLYVEFYDKTPNDPLLQSFINEVEDSIELV